MCVSVARRLLHPGIWTSLLYTANSLLGNSASFVPVGNSSIRPWRQTPVQGLNGALGSWDWCMCMAHINRFNSIIYHVIYIFHRYYSYPPSQASLSHFLYNVCCLYFSLLNALKWYYLQNSWKIYILSHELYTDKSQVHSKTTYALICSLFCVIKIFA